MPSNTCNGIPLKEIIAEVWAFLAVLLGALLLMILVPELATWLPYSAGFGR